MTYPHIGAVVVLVLALALALGSVAQAPADFSGKWALDVPHSIGLAKTQSRDVVLTITRTPNQLVIDRTTAGKATTTTYLLDGTETVRTDSDGTVVKSRSRWQDGALETEIAETRSLLGMTVVVPSHETCRVLADGALVMETTMKGGGKEVYRKSVFTRARN